MLKKLLSATAIYALAPQLPKVVNLLMLPILTKYLTPIDYGISGIIMAYIAGFSAFKDLGLRVSFTNTFFKYPTKYLFYWQRMHGFILIWAIVYGLLLIPLVYIIIPDLAIENFGWITLFVVLPIILFEPVSSLGRDYFQLNKMPMSFSIIAVVASLTAILVNYITIVIFKLGYLGFFISASASGFIGFCIYAYLIYYKMGILPSLDFNFRWIKKHLNTSLPTIPHYYAGYLLNISDRVLLDLYKIPIQEIGLYSFAYSIGTYFNIIGKSFWQASGPFYMEFYKEESKKGDMKARDLTYLFQIILIVLAFMICLWSKEIFNFMARNKELKSAYIFAIVIIMSYTYHPSYNFNGMKIWYSEKTKLLLKISFVAAIISVLLNVILIPIIGIQGSVIATFVSMMFMGFGGFLYKEIRLMFQVKFHALFWFLFICIVTYIAYSIKEIDIYFKLIITILLICFSILGFFMKSRIAKVLRIY